MSEIFNNDEDHPILDEDKPILEKCRKKSQCSLKDLVNVINGETVDKKEQFTGVNCWNPPITGVSKINYAGS